MGFFLKESIKLPWRIVVKQSDDFTIAIITRRHIVSAASRNSDIAGENDVAKIVTSRDE